MAIKLAVSTRFASDWRTQAPRWQAAGIQALELLCPGPLSDVSAQLAPGSIGGPVGEFGREYGLPLAGLAVELDLLSPSAAAGIETLKTLLEALGGQGHLRLGAQQLHRGQSHSGGLELIASHLSKLIPVASATATPVLLSSGGSFNQARDLWWICERVENPMLSISWDPQSGHLAQEPVAVSIPTLNARIGQILALDAIAGSPKLVPLGSGEIPWPQIAQRLRGIGYQGLVTFPLQRYPEATIDSVTQASEMLGKLFGLSAGEPVLVKA